ncbi:MULTISPECIES: Crp/Fnr family transcriptional regulator [unclassified Breznakia]|uniref:Crp/Fnr family transcriptional regulator n=1 Tax=unclassified Breznakia TaxID=2623764 RepID=UPI0024077308|nr:MULTISPECIES: Crp/Fnr family transcriptional regulator [unclassified Breznakia]MDF9837072.1 CRP-like cAMP-binding protein [Breznakia sp. PFB2-8]MDF9858997.1 CRP-like cAMP-binding protein [Breznakia sp. PH5-24]
MKYLRDIGLFDGVSEEALHIISQKVTIRNYKRNEILFHIGDIIQGVFVILEGNLEICSYDIGGNKKLVTVLDEGEMFAESVALGEDHISPFDIIATKPLKVAYITKEIMFTFQKQVLENMICILSTKNTFLTHKLECLNKNTVKERLYEVLNFYRIKQQSHIVNLPFNKTQLAEYLCVNRSSLSREIHLMEKDGIIKVEKQKYVLNKEFF